MTAQSDDHTGGPVAVGSRISDYSLERQIGRGGMAVVYLARDLRLDRPVALKLLAPQLAGNPQFRARFVRESQLAAAIDHPNIVPIYEAGEFAEQLYIAMRYVEGQDLGALLAAEGPLPIGRANRIFAQVAAALDVAHGHDLVHRDVKPANILLTTGADADFDHVYLTDFGLTKRSLSLSGFTSVGNFVGSIDYVSPEQIAGRAVDGRADVYALGCVIFEALAGVPPFQRDVDLGVLWAHLTEPPLPFAPYRPDLPPEVGEVLGGALAKEPEERYATCIELVTAIRDVVSAAAMDGPVRVRRPNAATSDSQPPQPPSQRPSEVAAVDAPDPSRPAEPAEAASFSPSPPAAPAAAPAAAHVPAPGANSVPAGAPAGVSTDRPRPRRKRWMLAAAMVVVVVGAAVGAVAATRGGHSVKWRHYAGSAAAPLAFDFPGNWSALTHTTVFALAAPGSRDLESLFATAPGGDWTFADRLIRSSPGRANGLYTGLNETLDPTSAASSLQDNLRITMPGEVTYSSGAQRTTVGGVKAVKLGGAVSGPGRDRLQFTSYVLARPGAAAYLTFFCVPGHCDDKAFGRVLATVRVLPSNG